MRSAMLGSGRPEETGLKAGRGNMAVKRDFPFVKCARGRASAIERVGAEVEKESGILLRDDASAGMLGLFEDSDLSSNWATALAAVMPASPAPMMAGRTRGSGL